MEEEKDLKEEDSKNNKKSGKTGFFIVGVVVVLILAIVIVFVIKKVSDLRCESSINVTNSNYKSKQNRIIDPSIYIESFDKPILYLYPEETTQLSVKLDRPEIITCSYPYYEDGWDVIANPDGTLVDINTGRTLYALYWEGKRDNPARFEEGFVVKGEDTIKFLEEKLSILGLNEREAEEFIVYWLPKMQENKYNLIRFETIDEINRNMPLEFSVEPDTLIRVLMDFKPIDGYIEIKEQKLETPERKGFVVVEWGASEIK